MNKEFVPRKQTIALEKLGFDEECLAGYNKDTNQLYISYEDGEPTFNQEYYVLAPLYQQAFRFFREKYGLFSEIQPYLIMGYQWKYSITDRNNSSNLPYQGGFKSYEDAELKCLKKLIKIVKTQKSNK